MKISIISAVILLICMFVLTFISYRRLNLKISSSNIYELYIINEEINKRYLELKDILTQNSNSINTIVGNVSTTSEQIKNNISNLNTDIILQEDEHEMDMNDLNSSLSSFQLDYNNKENLLDNSITTLNDDITDYMSCKGNDYDPDTIRCLLIKCANTTAFGTYVFKNELDGQLLRQLVSEGYSRAMIPRKTGNSTLTIINRPYNNNDYIAVKFFYIDTNQQVTSFGNDFYSILLFKPCPN